jgi:hypothetical protein
MDFASRLLLCAPFALAGTIAAAATQDTGSGSTLVPGYYDHKTHTFTPLPARVDPAAAPIPIKGKVVLDISAIIKSPGVPKTAGAIAFTSVSVVDAEFTGSAGKQMTLPRSGSVAAGKVTLPYFMTVLSKADKMQVGVTLVLTNTSTGPRPLYEFKQTIALPANNATTVVKVLATL